MAILRSEQFDDVYFSVDDGLEETRHVFIDGNHLPGAWRTPPVFTIAETGFGTGLNCLSVAKLFEETTSEDQRLDLISFEMYPLKKEVISKTLEPWKKELSPYLDRLLEQYPLRVPGFHRVRLSPRVSLTLVIGDINETISQLYVPLGVDAWFLDGFAPSKNPDMWSDLVFQQMARLSRDRARVATFTAASLVKRGLEGSGFTVEKKPGYGRKRDMITAQYDAGSAASYKKELHAQPRANIGYKPAKSVAIIGAGLAGTSCAYSLKQHGIEPVIFEKSGEIASGASGNMTGICNPRLSANKTAEADFYMCGFAQAYRLYSDLSDNDYTSCGTLHLVTNDFRRKRFQSLIKTWGWNEDHLRWVDAADASELSGVKIEHEALFLPESGVISPKKLCEAYAKDIDIRFNTQIDDPSALLGEFDAVILANAESAKSMAALDWLPIHTVRGQISKFSSEDRKLHTNVCYSGYVSASVYDTESVVGATFQRWLDDTDVKDEDHDENISHLCEAIPDLKDSLTVTGGRAGLRTSSKDRFPVAGRIPDRDSYKNGDDRMIDGLYISTAHGSHGLVATAVSARLITDMIMQGPHCMGRHSQEALCASRFLKRERRKGTL
jgi:tRNA 5-methylaminomethyl-2-thiouridine biosynthesis bifunctional protein